MLENDLTKAARSFLEEAVASGEIAGGSILLKIRGKEAAYAESGIAAASGIPFQRDTICRLYSMTKPVTAAAAMILTERGKLDPDRPVEDYLPAFRDTFVWEGQKRKSCVRPILIRDLWNMTSGLAYPGEDPAGIETGKVIGSMIDAFDEGTELTTRQAADAFARCGLSFQPGKQWMYGTSADVLGAVIEEVSGMRYGEFLKKELFDPLEMNDTGFFVPGEKQKRLADAFESTEAGIRKYRTCNLAIRYEMDRSPGFESGGAGLAGTIDDYAAFAAMLLNGGIYRKNRILSELSVAYLTGGSLLPHQTESMRNSWESLAGYGYGTLMKVLTDPDRTAEPGWKGQYGWDGWLGTHFMNVPSKEMTILLLCQKRDAGLVSPAARIRDCLLERNG